MTKKNNKTFLQTLMSLFKTQTKKSNITNTKSTNLKKTKLAKSSMKGGDASRRHCCSQYA